MPFDIKVDVSSNQNSNTTKHAYSHDFSIGARGEPGAEFRATDLLGFSFSGTYAGLVSSLNKITSDYSNGVKSTTVYTSNPQTNSNNQTSEDVAKTTASS